ncbi:pyridoxamine 5'-phosphate oxidase family protein, partial [Actinomadura adrarensis]
GLLQPLHAGEPERGAALHPRLLQVHGRAMDGDAVVFRTSLEGRLNQSLATAMTGAAIRIAFEVDDIDLEKQSGWSVLLRGGGQLLPDHERPPQPTVVPWAGGERPVYIRLDPIEVTGRRLGGQS